MCKSSCMFYFMIFMFFQQMSMSSEMLCDLPWNHGHSMYSETIAFKLISNFSELVVELSTILDKLTALPHDILHINQLVFIQLAAALNSSVHAIKSCSVPFFKGISLIFRSRKIPTTVDHLFDCLLTATIQEVFDTNIFGISLDDFLECSRHNRLVFFSFDFAKTLRQRWSESLYNGLLLYRKLLKAIQVFRSFPASHPHVSINHAAILKSKNGTWFEELEFGKGCIDILATIFYLTLEPSSACRDALQRLLSGCQPSTVPLLPADTNTLRIGRSVENICVDFCRNVLRGCLAPPLLFLPRQTGGIEALPPWEEMLIPPTSHPSSHPDLIHSMTHSLLSTLNATKLMELVIHQLDGVRADLPGLNNKLQLFCGGASLFGYPDVAVVNADAQEEVPIFEYPSYREERHDLPQSESQLLVKVQSVTEPLRRITDELSETRRFTEAMEQKYCGQVIPSVGIFAQQCWNGNAYAPYNKPVPPFTLTGQQVNPEFFYAMTNVQLHPPFFAVSETEEPFTTTLANEDENEQAGELENPKDLWNNEMEASGFNPMSGDLGFLPELQIPPKIEVEEERDLDLSDYALPGLYEGCSVDDEDCQLVSKPASNKLPDLDRSLDLGDVSNNSGPSRQQMANLSTDETLSYSETRVGGRSSNASSATTHSTATGTAHPILLANKWFTWTSVYLIPVIIPYPLQWILT